MSSNLLGTLNSSIKIFLEVAFILGPISIAITIALLKKIEQNNPERIRWR